MASPGIEPGFYGLKFTALSARPNGLDESVWPEFVLFRIGEAIDSSEPQESSNRASSIATPSRVLVGLRRPTSVYCHVQPCACRASPRNWSKNLPTSNCSASANSITGSRYVRSQSMRGATIMSDEKACSTFIGTGFQSPCTA